MTTSTFTDEGIERLEQVLRRHVETGSVPGLTWAVCRRGETRAGAIGLNDEGGTPVTERSIFRISSMTKPVTAVAALSLVEECVLRLDDPVDPWLPELADRRVLRTPEGPLDDTVAANRPITLRDLLTFTFGIGMDFDFSRPQPVLEAAAALGLGAGPPAPQEPPAPDEWLRRLGQLPLASQPGERWLYHTGMDVVGVLVARAAGAPLEQVLRERVLVPLGMDDTAFAVGPEKLDRFGPCYVTDPETGQRGTYDAADGQWAAPPAFPSGGAGLVSTAPDFLMFGRMLLGGGAVDGRRVLSRPAVRAMTSDQLADGSRAGFDPTGARSWGFGVDVHLRRMDLAAPGTYGWSGGLGSSWANDPAEELVGVLMTNQMWSSPAPPPVCQDFWTATYAAFAD